LAICLPLCRCCAYHCVSDLHATVPVIYALVLQTPTFASTIICSGMKASRSSFRHSRATRTACRRLVSDAYNAPPPPPPPLLPSSCCGVEGREAGVRLLRGPERDPGVWGARGSTTAAAATAARATALVNARMESDRMTKLRMPGHEQTFMPRHMCKHTHVCSRAHGDARTG
jgi:hypothetical protein